MPRLSASPSVFTRISKAKDRPQRTGIGILLPRVYPFPTHDALETKLRMDNYKRTTSRNIYGILMSSGNQSPGSKIPETDLLRRTPATSVVSAEADPFGRAPRLVRSSKKMVTVKGPVRIDRTDW